MAKQPLVPVEDGQQDGPDMRRCGRCGNFFRTPRAASDHIMRVHKGKGFRVRDDRDDEESLADIAIEASIKRASGERLDPLEESLLP